MLADVASAIGAFRAAPKPDVLKDTAVEIFSAYGIEAILCLDLPDRGMPVTVLDHDWPEDRLSDHEQGEHPLLRRARRVDEPFLWDDPQPSGESGAMEAIPLAIPVADTAERRGVILLLRPQGPPARSFYRELFCIAMNLYTELSDFRRRKHSPLTPRELEMLEWAGHGKTTDEIAEIFGLTSRTVNTHFENATRKLGTGNRLHTVVTAMRMKLIR